MNIEISSSIAELLGKGALLVKVEGSVLDRSRHTSLIPVLSPPKCPTCQGSEEIEVMVEGYDDETMDTCPDCVGGYPLGQTITLTTECDMPDCYEGEFRWQTAVDSYESEPCAQCKDGQVAACEGVLRAVLKVLDADDDANHIEPHLCFGWDRLFFTPREGDDIDVSHLSAVTEFTPGGWVLLLSDVRPL